MAEQTPPADVTQLLSQLTDRVQQLDSAVVQTVQGLAAQGIQLSVDLKGMMAAVRRSLRETREGHDREDKERLQLQQLLRTSALITSKLDLDQVLEEVMDTIIELTGAQRGYLMLRDHEDDELTVRVARNWDRETLAGNDAAFSRRAVNAALEQGEPLVAMNAQFDDRFQMSESVMAQGLRSILCIPLSLRGQTVGVLYADNRIDQGVFSQDSIPLLTAFGNQVAVAIENARLFEQVRADLDKAQREVQRLRIQVDQNRMSQQVGEITESEYFQQLSARVRELRDQTRDED